MRDIYPNSTARSPLDHRSFTIRDPLPLGPQGGTTRETGQVGTASPV